MRVIACWNQAAEKPRSAMTFPDVVREIVEQSLGRVEVGPLSRQHAQGQQMLAGFHRRDCLAAQAAARAAERLGDTAAPLCPAAF